MKSNPKQQARKVYEQAKSAGKRASLIEQQRPNMFTSSVANIAPNDKITVVIEYQQTIIQNQNTFSLRFPMAITPRYIPGKAITNTGEVRDFDGHGWGGQYRPSAGCFSHYATGKFKCEYQSDYAQS